MTCARTLMPLLAAMAVWSGAIAGPLSIESVSREPLALEDYPGQQQLTVRFRNESGEPDPSAWVLLPVPVGFEVVGGSIRGPGAAGALSGDGGETFVPESEWAPDDLALVTHVRWEFSAPVAPGVSGIVSLRLRPMASEGE